MRVRTRWAFLLCLLFCQAGGGIAWASIEDIWGTPLLVRELAAKLPCILFDEIPIQNWDTPVRWCEEAWCVTPVESTNLFWAGAPLCLLVGSVMEALLGPITYSIGRAVASEVPLEDELQDELPLISEPLSANDVAIVQGYTLTVPPGFTSPAMAVVVVLEKDGELVNSRSRYTTAVDELSVTRYVHDGARGQAFAFHWMKLPTSCIPDEAFVVTRAERLELGRP